MWLTGVGTGCVSTVDFLCLLGCQQWLGVDLERHHVGPFSGAVYSKFETPDV